ncbi:MAG TPA: YfiR/HmsC family protein [Polyangiaceae bacterium]|nr:YfiR/HmsC family protein [Polyangiaceae bacterium]
MFGLPRSIVRFRRAAHSTALSLSLGVLTASSGLADGAQVPPGLQAELVAKLAAYDRNFAARAGETAHLLLLVNPKDPRSAASATAMRNALRSVGTIGGLPHVESLVTYETPATLANRCRAEHAAILYVTPGFDDQLDALRNALSELDLLTVAAERDAVARGMVLGFDVVAGKLKLVVNLSQAKRQNVAFRTEALALMVVIR